MSFLRAAEREHTEAPQTDDRIVRTAEAEVALVAPASVRRAAALLTENALEFTTEKDYARLRDRFVDLAQAEIDTGN